MVHDPVRDISAGNMLAIKQLSGSSSHMAALRLVRPGNVSTRYLYSAIHTVAVAVLAPCSVYLDVTRFSKKLTRRGFEQPWRRDMPLCVMCRCMLNSRIPKTMSCRGATFSAAGPATGPR
nr:hypothetical protein CFP56_00496 [Quercus suber]